MPSPPEPPERSAPPVVPAAAHGRVATRVWALPPRLVPWQLAAAVLGLPAFRLLWGLLGGRWSRFNRFVYSPGAVWRHLKGATRAHEHHDLGHSPQGSLAVFALLGALALQPGTGLVADDEIANSGPQNRDVSTDAGLGATASHKNLGQWPLLGLVALHAAAIARYAWRQRGLALVLAGVCSWGVWQVMRLGHAAGAA
jgi:cytochrome b